MERLIVPDNALAELNKLDNERKKLSFELRVSEDSMTYEALQTYSGFNNAQKKQYLGIVKNMDLLDSSCSKITSDATKVSLLENIKANNKQEYLNLAQLITEPYIFKNIVLARKEDVAGMIYSLFNNSEVFNHKPEALFRAFREQKNLIKEMYVFDKTAELRSKGFSETEIESRVNTQIDEKEKAYALIGAEFAKLFK